MVGAVKDLGGERGEETIGRKEGEGHRGLAGERGGRRRKVNRSEE